MYRVELKDKNLNKIAVSDESLFLMYRVELKGFCNNSFLISFFSNVPNVPCGVERKLVQFSRLKWLKKFLMYRVELKDSFH